MAISLSSSALRSSSRRTNRRQLVSGLRSTLWPRADSSGGGQVDDRALIAHVLRRTTFGPFPGQVEALTARGVDAAIDAIVSAPPLQPAAPEFGTDDDERVLVDWWLDVMSDPAAGLHEKMTWFWHGHLTSSLDKAEVQLMWRQHQLIRKHAMGNFREMLQAITIDAAMLAWLDGNGSTAEAPNENYGREVMELFALGHGGGYSEADVRAAAVAFSGWWIDEESNNTVRFDPQSGPPGPVTLLGSPAASAADAIDIICDHPSCASHIANKLHRAFTGVSPSAERTAELAGIFTASGLEIRPLIEAIITDPSFLELRMNRPRVPVEWYIAANAVLGAERDMWILNLLGQMPFTPPNVAGWPMGDRWLSAGAAFTRAQVAWDNAWDTEVTDDSDPVEAILAKASLYEVSDGTRNALRTAARAIEERRDRASILHALVVCCPEFAQS